VLPGEDGNHVVNQDIQTPFKGPSVEVITDVNFDEDCFDVQGTIGFAADIGVVSGANLQEAANSAIQTVLLQGGVAQRVAAQFTFNGREYLAIDQGGFFNTFTDSADLLMEITGATGTIGVNDFI
jgi:hypothetical protein